MTDYMFAIKDKNGLYLANPLWHLRWTKTLIRAQFFLKRVEAEQALTKRAGEVVMVEVREVDLSDFVEVVIDDDNITN